MISFFVLSEITLDLVFESGGKNCDFIVIRRFIVPFETLDSIESNKCVRKCRGEIRK